MNCYVKDVYTAFSDKSTVKPNMSFDLIGGGVKSITQVYLMMFIRG